MDGSPKSQVVSIITEATNVLVTVGKNPSVDQLSAMIGLTLLINKADKHGAAVFSGEVPSTLEFLEPEQTVEKNTDSLRDFIISLDKTKADKLRYKVEDDVVKIFITPYKVSLSGNDFEFSQGDFNVDVVVALGVSMRDDLDKAITSHGRILHDAKVVTISNTADQSDLGAINWQDPSASSLCEMIASMVDSMQAGLMDAQISTALLTGIVAETERFRNSKTSPLVMTLAAELMSAGANQQLIAAKLDVKEEPQKEVTSFAETEEKETEKKEIDSAIIPDSDGVLRLDHENDAPKTVKVSEQEQEQDIQVIEEAKDEKAPLPPSLPDVVPPEVSANVELNSAAVMEDTKKPEVDVPLIEVPQIESASNIPQPVTIISPTVEEHTKEDKPKREMMGSTGGIHIDEHGNINPLIEDNESGSSVESHNPSAGTFNHGIKIIEPLQESEKPQKRDVSSIVLNPPTLGGSLNAVSAQTGATIGGLQIQSQTVAPDLVTPQQASALDFSLHDSASGHIVSPLPEPVAAPQVSVENAREAVTNVIDAMPYNPARPEPIESLNAQPIDLSADSTAPTPAPESPVQSRPAPPSVPPPIIPQTPTNSTNPYLNPSNQAQKISLPPVMPQ